jgi:hypothetical protein
MCRLLSFVPSARISQSTRDGLARLRNASAPPPTAIEHHFVKPLTIADGLYHTHTSCEHSSLYIVTVMCLTGHSNSEPTLERKKRRPTISVGERFQAVDSTWLMNARLGVPPSGQLGTLMLGVVRAHHAAIIQQTVDM